jgi:hypothetical protein
VLALTLRKDSEKGKKGRRVMRNERNLAVFFYCERKFFISDFKRRVNERVWKERGYELWKWEIRGKEEQSRTKEEKGG